MTSEADLSLGRQVTKFQQTWNEDLILKATKQFAEKQTALPRLSDPEFKSRSKQILDLLLVVPGSNSQLHLNIAKCQSPIGMLKKNN